MNANKNPQNHDYRNGGVQSTLARTSAMLKFYFCRAYPSGAQESEHQPHQL